MRCHLENGEHEAEVRQEEEGKGAKAVDTTTLAEQPRCSLPFITQAAQRQREKRTEREREMLLRCVRVRESGRMCMCAARV